MQQHEQRCLCVYTPGSSGHGLEKPTLNGPLMAGKDETTVGVVKLESEHDITATDRLARVAAVELVHDKEALGGQH